MMLLAYNHARPTYTVTGGSLVTDAAALSDRSPASATRITWPTGTQTTATTCTITAGFTEQAVRAVAILGTSLPVGLKVELRGKRAGDADYTYSLGAASFTQTLVSRIDGGTGAVWVLPLGNDALIGLQIRLYNDVGGFTSLSAGDSFDIGQIVISGGAEFYISTEWTLGGKDPSTSRRTLGSQVSRVGRPGYRILEFSPALDDEDAVLFGDLSNGASWQELARDIRGDPYVLAIASTKTTDYIQATSIYGEVTKIPDFLHKAGPYYEPNQTTVEEIPATL